MPNIIDDEDLYTSVILAGVPSPGRVTLSGHDRKVSWDIKGGHGLNGARMTLKEIPPVEFTATFQLVIDLAQGINDFEKWPAFQALIDSTVAKTPKALDIYHPDLAQNDIKSVAKASIGGFVYDGKGGATVAVKFQEYRPPKKSGGTPSGSSSKDPAKGTDPNQAAKDEVARLTQQYQNTPWG